jgi:nucleoid DNA-binding protein
MKTTQKTIVAKISENTGLSRARSKRAFKSTLGLIRDALGAGKQVDLGKIGKLKLVTRKLTRRIEKNLNGGAMLESVYQRYLRTVRLLGGGDLSENPLPTIVHKHPGVVTGQLGTYRRSFAVARPRWRGRPS